MKYHYLGKTGLKVSQLAFGTMSFGGDADRIRSKELFAAARDAGINFFDCANVYNNGTAEEILGECVAQCRTQVILSTKAYFPTSSDVNARGLSRYHLIQSVEQSLRRLRTDYIDIFFLHRFDEQTDPDQTMRAIEDLIRSGKILYPAVSNFSAWQTMKHLSRADLLGVNPIVACQPMYNLLKRQAEVEILPMAQAEKIGVIPYSPMAGGLLSGKYLDQSNASGRLQENKMYQVRYGVPGYQDAIKAFVAYAKDHNYSPAALAIAWVAAHPGVTCPLVGARSLEQLATCLSSINIVLNDEERKRISNLVPAPGPATDRNEEETEHNYGSR